MKEDRQPVVVKRDIFEAGICWRWTALQGNIGGKHIIPWGDLAHAMASEGRALGEPRRLTVHQRHGETVAVLGFDGWGVQFNPLTLEIKWYDEGIPDAFDEAAFLSLWQDNADLTARLAELVDVAKVSKPGPQWGTRPESFTDKIPPRAKPFAAAALAGAALGTIALLAPLGLVAAGAKRLWAWVRD